MQHCEPACILKFAMQHYVAHCATSIGDGMEVEEAIAALKRKFRASTDQKLAERLAVGRSTITSWRRRGSIPKRYVHMINPTSERPFDLPLEQWSDEENAAMKLALYRIIRDKEGTLTSYPEFLSYSGLLWPKFTILLDRSFLDVVAQMEERGIEDPADCVNLVVYEEFFENKD